MILKKVIYKYRGEEQNFGKHKSYDNQITRTTNT